MVHWSDYSLRGWLSFLSFMHIGTAFRCFYDKHFLRDKIFTTDAANDTAFHHLYGIYNIMTCFILIQSSVYLYVMPSAIFQIDIILWFISIPIHNECLGNDEIWSIDASVKEIVVCIDPQNGSNGRGIVDHRLFRCFRRIARPEVSVKKRRIYLILYISKLQFRPHFNEFSVSLILLNQIYLFFQFISGKEFNPIVFPVVVLGNNSATSAHMKAKPLDTLYIIALSDPRLLLSLLFGRNFVISPNLPECCLSGDIDKCSITIAPPGPFTSGTTHNGLGTLTVLVASMAFIDSYSPKNITNPSADEFFFTNTNPLSTSIINEKSRDNWFTDHMFMHLVIENDNHINTSNANSPNLPECCLSGDIDKCSITIAPPDPFTSGTTHNGLGTLTVLVASMAFIDSYSPKNITNPSADEFFFTNTNPLSTSIINEKSRDNWFTDHMFTHLVIENDGHIITSNAKSMAIGGNTPVNNLWQRLNQFSDNYCHTDCDPVVNRLIQLKQLQTNAANDSRVKTAVDTDSTAAKTSTPIAQKRHRPDIDDHYDNGWPDLPEDCLRDGGSVDHIVDDLSPIVRKKCRKTIFIADSDEELDRICDKTSIEYYTKNRLLETHRKLDDRDVNQLKELNYDLMTQICDSMKSCIDDNKVVDVNQMSAFLDIRTKIISRLTPQSNGSVVSETQQSDNYIHFVG
ncbi:unnamed protein product [Medioppia subpectinata]|uniref:Uncharacterized protein n=1 Tax=Medioppia subpectinata TaxID=1979941 RepID=A0A7R9Q2J7_9ACAR|nr:unnamed protein product [Medioppia subpectinata]CAG2109499.1 unnamed protein product [Medioppia subpectinata]